MVKFVVQIRISGSDDIAKFKKCFPTKREETFIYLYKYKANHLQLTQIRLVRGTVGETAPLLYFVL